MAVKDKTDSQLAVLAGQRADSGMRYPNVGNEPVFPSMIQMLDQLSLSAAHWLRVCADDNGASSTTHIRILPGRATIDGLPLAYSGGTIDLAANNNDVTYIWAYINTGAIAITGAVDGTGWPATSHVKLAEVTLLAGAITTIVDRRAESMLVGGLPRMPVFTTAGRPAAATAGRVIYDSDLAKLILDTGAAWVNVDGTALS